MGRFKDLTGMRFGKLIAIETAGKDLYQRFYWLCKCDCGALCKVKSNNLSTGNSTSCGCSNRELGRGVKNLAGNVYGELTVIERDMSRASDGKVFWLCECSCGEIVSVWMAHLQNKHNVKCSVRGNHSNSNSAKRAHWGVLVKEKYDNECQKCGSTDNLHAHHVLSFTAHESLRYDVDNGSCLCRGCHKDFHQNYGRMKNTEEEFYEWLTSAREEAKL